MKKGNMRFVSMLLTSMIITSLMLGSYIPISVSTMAAENSISDEEWEAFREAAKNRQRRVIRDNDGMDCTDLPVSRGISIQSFYDYRTSYLTEYPVDTICYTPKSACFGYLTTRTDVGDRYLDNYPAELGSSTVNITPWLHGQNTDALQLQIDFAREHDIEIFAGIRINDTHDHSDRPDAPHNCYSPFKREHPELVVGNDLEYPPYEIPYGRWSAFDFTQEAMRQYFYDVTAELIEDYDIDGVFFDFYRHGVFFKSVAFGEPISQSELDAMTELFTDIRAFAEACGRQRGRPILISMRVPDSLEYCKAIGIDLENWIEDDLVDIIIGGGYFHINPWDYLVDICHEKGIKYYASIERPLDTSYYGDILPDSIKRLAPEDYFAREAAAFQAGVDGNFYFNLFTETMVRDNIRPDYESIKLEDKRYFITDIVRDSPSYFLKDGSSYCENLPRLWAQTPALIMPGQESRYILEFGDDVAALKAEGLHPEMIASLYGPLVQPDRLIITSNGQQWNYIASNGDFHYYRVPDTALSVGSNEVKLVMPGVPDIQVQMETIMTGSKPMMTGKDGYPWRRLFATHNKSESEQIVDGSYFCIDSGEGRIGHVYPLALPQSGSFGDEFDFTLSFDCKVVEASDDRSVVIRIADGRYIETVSLQADKITLLSSGTSVDFDTTDDMHHYELTLRGNYADLSADGVQLINDAELKWPVGTNEAKLVGTGGFGFEGMDERSVLFGSLSVEGTSQAFWRNIAVPRISGSEQICDFSVQMNFCGDFQKRDVDSWKYQTNESSLLEIDNKDFSSSTLLVGEVDFAESCGTAEVIISNGNSFITQVINSGITQFEDVGDRSGRCVNWPGAETTHTRRYEFDNTGGRYFCGDELPVAFTATGTVTSFLSSENAARLNETERQVVRNGGIVVRPLADQPSVVGIRASVVEQNVVPDANLRAEINAILDHANDTWITEDDMAGLTGTLALDSKNINDIEGLQYATGVTSINLNNNHVRDLAPLTNLTNLKELNLDNNSSIADLAPLQNLYLDHLSINAGQIVDLSPLKDMDALGSDSSKTYVTGQTGYIMPQNTIFPNPLKDRNGDIIPVVETDNIKNAEGGNLEIVGDYSGNLETSWDVTTTWMTDDGNHSIQFQGILIVDTRMELNIVPDINMREAINQILVRPAYTWVTETDMESFTGTLDISGQNIKSIEGMQYATGVTYINIYNNQISDITPLQGLTGLTRLIVSSNQISDLAPLANLTNLTYLNLYINNVSDLTPLANLTNLTEIRLGYNSNISDLSPLKNILGLNYISINSGKIMDLSPLKDMDELVANTSKTYVTGQMGHIKPESCFFPNPLKDRNGNTIPVIETDYIKNAGGGYLEIVGDYPGSVATSWDVTNTWQTGDVNHSIRFAGTLTIDTGSIILETQASAPTAAPEEGTYYETKHIELSTITRNAKIYYTIDGSDPTTESTEYTEPVTAGVDMTIKAIAVKEGLDNSPISTFEYSIPNVVIDANLRGAINGILKRSVDSWVSAEDVAGLSGSLSIASKSIESVEGLQYLTDSITVISAHTNNISDLSPFTEMKNDNLYRILFSMNNISDLTPLATLTKLTFLNLYQNNISDLTPLSNMTIMDDLRLGNNSNISDLTPLQNMLVLQKLSLNTGKVTDLSPLANISKLGPAANGTDAYVTGQSGYVRPSSCIFPNPLKDRNGDIVPVIETDYVKNAEGGNLLIEDDYPDTLEASWDITNKWITDGEDYGIRFAGILTIDTCGIIDDARAAVPTATPGEGTYYETKYIELTTATEGATIYYTIDGSDPTTESSEYTAPITAGTDMTIKAIAIKEGMKKSLISTFEYSVPNVVTDANLRAVINGILNRSADSWVSAGDVAGLSGSLSIGSKSIESVEGLQYLTDKVNVISAHTNNISDLSPFTGMKNDNLYRILFSMNNISDLTPLATLTKLTFLNLYKNNISDLTPLSNMTIMDDLRLGYNSNISDLTPLQNMLVLQKLSLNEGKVTDLSPLANISKLGPAANGTDAYVTGQSGYIRPSSRIFPNPLKDRNGDTVPITETDNVKNTEEGKLEITGNCSDNPEASWDITNKWITDGEDYGIRFAGILTIDTSEIIDDERIAAPTANPGPGTYYETQNVELTTTTEGAIIYYTTDGSTPATSSSVYTAAIPVSADMIIKAIAVKEGMEDSSIATFEYVIQTQSQLYEITIAASDNGTTSGSGIYASGQSVTLNAVPEPGYNFEGWYIGDTKISSLPNYTFVATENITLTARFTEIKKRQLMVATIGNGVIRLNEETANLTPDYMGEHDMGATIRLTAIANEGHVFAYWQDAHSESIISTSPFYEFIMGAGAKVKAVFSRIPTEETTDFTVIFKDKNGRMLKSTSVSKGQSTEPPSAVPALAGYNFVGWDKPFDSIASDTTINALYVRLDTEYTVTVLNGELSTGGQTGQYKYDMPVTVIAGNPPEGQKFSHWEQDGKKISIDNIYRFFTPMKDTTFEAIFVDSNEIIESTPFITLSNDVQVDAVNKTMMFVANRTVPEGYILVESGILLLQSDIPLSDEITVDTENVIHGKIKNNSTDQFYIRKIDIQPGNTWYARAYLIYRDGGGNIITVYSDNTVSKTME